MIHCYYVYGWKYLFFISESVFLIQTRNEAVKQMWSCHAPCRQKKKNEIIAFKSIKSETNT